MSGSVSFGLTERRPDVPTGLTVRVAVDQQPGESGPTQLRSLRITLPDGVGLGAQARTAGGDFQLCDPGAFAVAGTLAAACPAGSVVGRVAVAAPAGTLSGPVYVGTPSTDSGLPSVFVEAAAGGSTDPGAPRIKLAGSLAVGGDGRLGLTFDQVPDPPFSSMELELAGGDGAVLTTPRVCSSYAGVASMSSALTGATFASASTVTIDQDCAAGGFAPSVAVWSGNPQAGASGPSGLAVDRPDRAPRLGATLIALPPGLMADIGGTPECGLTGGAAASCGPDARVGTVELTAGLGSTPRTYSGSIFITPRQPGAVAGAHAVIRMRSGDLDLGDLVVPVRMDLRPTDAGINIGFDVPNRFRGIDLATRRLALSFDRPNFALNPSNCAPLGFGSTLVADTGAVAGPGGQITYGGCERLPFAPTLEATLTGEIGGGGHPNVSVALNARAGDANLGSANVTLPSGIAPDVKNIQNQCPLATFDAVACSAATRVGTATARVAVTPEPIPGDVYLVRIPGETLPGLGLSFTGRYAQRVLSVVRIDPKSKRLIVRFDAIPDLPLRRLDMDIFGGARGPIKIQDGPCVESAVWDATFGAHGPQVSSHTIPASCAPRAAKRAAVTLSSRYGLTWRMTDLGGRTLQSAKLTLPAGFLVVRGRASRKQYRSVKLAGATAKLSFTTKAVIVSARGKATRTLAVKLKQGSIRRSVPLKPKQGTRRVRLKVRLAFTDGTVQNQTITVRAK